MVVCQRLHRRRLAPPFQLGSLLPGAPSTTYSEIPSLVSKLRCTSPSCHRPWQSFPSVFFSFPSGASPFSSCSSSSPGKRQQQHANIGRATEVLRHELPDFFQPVSNGGTMTGLGDKSIYARRVTFSDPFHIRGFIVRGRTAYAFLAGMLRFACIAYFQEPAVDIVRMVQIKGPLRGEHLDDVFLGEWGRPGDGDRDSDGLDGSASPGLQRRRAWRREEVDDGGDDDQAIRLVVRWVFEGTPRHQLLFSSIWPKSAVPVVYEGVFVYRFDADGLIDNHRLQSMFPSPPMLAFCKWFKRDMSSRGTTGAEVPTFRG
ncbi:hypothetical protein DFJ73DRAFT_135126 [Zopfochytrium polystomum]|nr:hypothetical protein DFJ73DRAFT_135126 [Zopfochytrium polystomum]